MERRRDANRGAERKVAWGVKAVWRMVDDQPDQRAPASKKWGGRAKKGTAKKKAWGAK